jgi:hypothetical protein
MKIFGNDQAKEILGRALLTKEQILQAADATYEEIEVPEWGGWVRVRALSGAERDRFEASVAGDRPGKSRMNLLNVRARLVALAVVDETNRPLFSQADVEALGRKNAAALDRVFDVAQRLAGVSDADLEELEGNSAAGQSDDSVSAWH